MFVLFLSVLDAEKMRSDCESSEDFALIDLTLK